MGKRERRRGLVGSAAGLSYEGWRKFFRSDVAQVTSRASRILKLVERLRSSPASPGAVKMVAGIIGRDTVGHSGEIREVFRELLGVECLGCDEVVKMVSRGVPLQLAIGSARLSFGRSEWLDELMLLERLTRESLGRSGVLEASEEFLEDLAERDYSALVGNPLGVLSMIRGLYASLRGILPLYSPHAFFIQALRGIPRFALEKLAWRSCVEAAGRLNVVLEELLPCADAEYSILSHVPGSTGDVVSSSIDAAYKLHDLALRGGLRRLRVADERERYLEEALPAAAPVAEMLGVEREFSSVSRALLSEGRAIDRHRGFRLVELRVKTERPARYVTVGRVRMGAGSFVSGVTPYLVLGLGRVVSVERRDAASVIFNLVVYTGAG